MNQNEVVCPVMNPRIESGCDNVPPIELDVTGLAELDQPPIAVSDFVLHSARPGDEAEDRVRRL
jgi:hypothetical protein